jgi:antitoxin MazE
MNIKLKKWGNSLGLLIPHKLAASLNFNKNSTVEIAESKRTLVITLDELLSSIPPNFQYPNDVTNFIESAPTGQELL